MEPSTPVNVPPAIPEKSKTATPGIALGIFVGIFQLIIMFVIVSSCSYSMQIFGLFNNVGSWGTIIYIIILLLPLIIEFIFLRKTHKLFVRGVAIGTILVPLIGIGLCFGFIFLGGLNGL
jgi:hypothetical protein